MWFKRFVISNTLYIIWFVFYFTIAWAIFGADWKSFAIVSAIYAVSLTVAFSPVGEILLAITQGCREPQTDKEKNYLLPIFEEVYQSAKEVNPDLNSGMKIYIIDAMYVNAFAMGRKTIAVTRGAMETFNKEELKGVIAHELGHMTYGHTKALLLTNIGNLLFTAIVFVLGLIVKIADAITSITANMNIVCLVFKFITLVTKIYFHICVFLFVNLGQIILAINSQANEMQADKFAYTAGFGKHLTDALYLLQKISMNRKMKLSEWFKASHPHIATRIERLEYLEGLPE